MAAGIAAALLTPIAGGVALAVLNLAALALFGHCVEDAIGRLRFPALLLAGGLIAFGACAAIDAGAGSAARGTAAAYGTVAAALGAYAVLRPRAKILTVLLAPFATTVVELPAAVLIALWLALQLALGLAVAGQGAGWLAYLLALPAGAAAAWPLVAARAAAGRAAGPATSTGRLSAP